MWRSSGLLGCSPRGPRRRGPTSGPPGRSPRGARRRGPTSGPSGRATRPQRSPRGPRRRSPRPARLDAPRGPSAHHKAQLAPRGARPTCRALMRTTRPQRAPRGPLRRVRPGRAPRAPAHTTRPTSDVGPRPACLDAPRGPSAHREACVRRAHVRPAWTLTTNPQRSPRGPRRRGPHVWPGCSARCPRRRGPTRGPQLLVGR
jgi:hypothetical protein